jgi:hypothetical protein
MSESEFEQVCAKSSVSNYAAGRQKRQPLCDKIGRPGAPRGYFTIWKRPQVVFLLFPSIDVGLDRILRILAKDVFYVVTRKIGPGSVPSH